MLAWLELLTDLAWHEILHRHFRPSQSRKWITAKWLTHGKQLQEVAVLGTLKKPPSSRPILIYFEFRSKPSLITVISMDPRPTNYLRQNIVFSYPEMIRVSFSLFLSLSVFFCYFTLLSIFSCSGMFRNVPCSGFYRRPFLTVSLKSSQRFSLQVCKQISRCFIVWHVKILTNLRLRHTILDSLWCWHEKLSGIAWTPIRYVTLQT